MGNSRSGRRQIRSSFQTGDVNVVRDGWVLGIRPPEDLTVSQWAAKYRVLSQNASSEHGPWTNDRTPYLVEIMDSLSPSDPSNVIVFEKGSQIGGTECGNNWVGSVIHINPAPMLYIMPSLDDVQFAVQQRLDTMIEDSPVLRNLVYKPRARDGKNTKKIKMFPGGVLRLVGSFSPRALRGMPACYVYADEIDEYPDNVGDEGDPIDLVMVRQRTFGIRRKILLTSSPTRQGKSKIHEWYQRSDQRRYLVPCLKCGAFQEITWKRIVFKKEGEYNVKPGSVYLECEHCGRAIHESEKTEMLAAGRWKATAVGQSGVKGFHLSGLYSPLGWYSWEQAAGDFLKANYKLKQEKSAESLKVFINTVLGEPYEDASSGRVQWSDLYVRRGGYRPNPLPKEVMMLTAGIDVQDDRLAVLIVGFGKYEKSYRIHYEHIFGDPALPAVWRRLDELLYSPYRHESGADLHIVSAAVDTGGHRTHDVYNYARTRDPVVMAIKGSNQPGRPVIGKPTAQDVTYNGVTIKDGVMLWPIGTDTAKTLLFSRMKMTGEDAPTWHFHDGLDESYFRELTSEYRRPKYVKGQVVDEWVRDYPRAEALDCEVYAYAAAVRAGIMRINWDQLEQLIIRGAEEQIKKRDTEESLREMRGDKAPVGSSEAEPPTMVEEQLSKQAPRSSMLQVGKKRKLRRSSSPFK